MKETRSDFWKCGRCENLHRDLSVLANSEKCSLCDPFDPRERRKDDIDATPAEVLAAWLLADDDRRREIELASRPKEAGKYVLYFIPHKLDSGRGTVDRHTAWVFEHLGKLHVEYDRTHGELEGVGGFWEPIE